MQENQRFDSVWDALEDTPQAAQNMTLRSDLMIDLEQYIKRRKLTQTQAAELFGVTQPRISDLKRGKIGLFSLDALINMAVTAGMKVEMRITERKPLGGKSQEKAPPKKPKKTAAG